MTRFDYLMLEFICKKVLTKPNSGGIFIKPNRRCRGTKESKMGFGRGGYSGGQQGGYGGGGGGGRQGGYEPKPGQGTLFIKNDKRSQQAPDYDGYFIFEHDIRAGEKVKLVGWDKSGRTGNMITLKLGRERQDAPGYNQGGQQGGYNGGGQGGYQQPPQNNGYQQGYQQPPQGGYQQAPQGGYNRGPAQGGYAPPAGAAPTQPGQPTYPAPPPEDDLPF